MGTGPVPTPPTARTLRRTLKRFIWCAAVYFPPGRVETALQRPLQVSWGRTLCLVSCSPVLLPHCGCWVRINTASGLCSLSRPQSTWALYPMHCSVFSTKPGGGSPSTSSTSPLGPCSVPRSSFPRVTFSLCVPGLCRHCRRSDHSIAPLAHTGALSDALQCVLCPSGGRPPSNDLYSSPGVALRTSILVPQRYFLIGGAGPAPTPLVDSALSACGRFVRCTVAYFLPGRVETALQHPLQVPWRPAPRLVPPSPMLLPRYGCRACTVTAGGPRSQCTRALYPMHCSVFSAKSGGVCPSMCSSGKRRSRRQGRVTMRVPGLDHGRKPRSHGSSGAPHALGSDSPSFLWTPGAPGYRLYKSMVPESGLFSRINWRPLRSHVL
ncbi:hypothetical protein NDU88_008118 [Pleurodeles waltl]|uniref:Uncharacterized protein n=1 Tax=Pleurodeles waltl TaxID=8319 RepID=A0AAV7VUJ7_PLEWA|nr:hypothetical protein NDU88_008118 [Pleurodeles waltl]